MKPWVSIVREMSPTDNVFRPGWLWRVASGGLQPRQIEVELPQRLHDHAVREDIHGGFHHVNRRQRPQFRYRLRFQRRLEGRAQEVHGPRARAADDDMIRLEG